MMRVSLVSHQFGLKRWAAAALIAGSFTGFASLVMAGDKDPAFKIGGKVTTIEQVSKDNQSEFFDLEEKKYRMVEQSAHQKYLDYFWQQKAKETGTSVEAARKSYLEKNSTVSEKEIAETLEKYKNHPQLQKLEKAEQTRQVRDFLKDKSERDVLDGIVQAGLKKGDLVVSYPRPQEPVFEVPVVDNDNVRYGPELADVKPAGCTKDCAVTVVEYSEFQCPFCEKVLPDTKRILGEYKGKIRWIVRDFPLSFHDRAKPAAIAAHCAADQGKFWNMYNALFENQKSLTDADFKTHAEKIGLDKKKYEACVANPGEINATIEKNIQTGAKLGVNGTPAFFINGRKLSGALPYAEFKRVIEEEMKKAKRS